jgi:hypothetical protein
MSQAAADALQRRLMSFAVKIMELVGHMPKTPFGRHVSGQVLRSGTSPAPTTAKLGVRRAVPTSFINSESASKSSMRPASGSS